VIQAKPRMVPGRGEAEHSQCDGDWDALLGSVDGAQDGGLGFTGWHPLGVEAEAKQPDQHEDEAHNAEQELDSALELHDSCAELLLVLAEEFRGDHRSCPTADPAGGSGPGDAQLGEEGGTAFLADEVADAVVICSAAGAVWHGPGVL